jgi:hypothetical protein
VYLAQESIEKVRAMRDFDEQDGWTYEWTYGWNRITNNYITASAANKAAFGHTGLGDLDGYVQINGINSIFRRAVYVLENDADNAELGSESKTKRVTVRVEWDEYDRKASVELTTVLTKHD